MSIPKRSFFTSPVPKRSSFQNVTVIAAAALTLSAMTISSSQAQTAQSNLRNSSLFRVNGYAPSELIVTYKVNPLNQEIKDLNAKIGARTKQTFSFIRTQRVGLPANLSIAEASKKYAADPNVAKVQPNYQYQGLAIPNDPLYLTQQYGPKIINAPGAWDYVTGYVAPSTMPVVAPPKFKNPRNLIRWLRENGNQDSQRKDVVIAVIDTGVALNHVDLRANLWRNTKEIAGNGKDDDDNGYIDDIFGIDTVGTTNSPLGDTNPNDDDGHGTHVAGIIGAVGNNTFGVTGINWRTKIMALKFLSARGGGFTSGALSCMQYMIRMKRRGVNVRVANHSWGPVTSPETGVPFDAALEEAFRNASREGILNVIAAGNGDSSTGQGVDNDQFATYPANLQVPNKLVVAASDRNDNPAVFRNDAGVQVGATNFGSDTVDLAAPGLDILSTYPFVDGVGGTATTVVEIPNNRTFKSLSGTSMAAPHVAGVAALLFTFSPELTASQVRQSILDGVDTASDKPVLAIWQGLVRSGGRLNAFKALQESVELRGTPLPPIGSIPVTPILPAPPGLPTDPTDPPTDPTDPPTDPTNPPTGTAPLLNGNIVFTEDNTGIFPHIDRIGPNGENQSIIVGGIRFLQNPYVSLRSGKIAYAVELANATENPNTILDFQDPFRFGFGTAFNNSFPESEIYVRTTIGDFRITNDEANRADPVDDREPAISPDGTRIAFVKRNDAGNDDIYITSSFQDFTRPGAAPAQELLVSDAGDGASQESRPSWSPDGTKLVFQSDRGEGRDYDIYIINVPANFLTDGIAQSALPAMTQLTNNPGDDIEPSIGPITAESRIARPNGQLVYASRRNDFESEQTSYSLVKQDFNTQGLLIGSSPIGAPIPVPEDYDIYLQNLSLENDTTNRSQRIVDNQRRFVTVLLGTGDTGLIGVDLADGNNQEDNFGLSFAISGDDRRPVMSADGTAVIFCSDSNFRRPNVTDDDFDIFSVDINGRNFRQLTNDTPVRTRIDAGGTGLDYGSLSASEDYEPSAAATVTATSPGSGALGTASAASRTGFLFPSEAFKR